MDGNQLLLDPSVASLVGAVGVSDVASLSDWDGNASVALCASDCLPRTHAAITSCVLAMAWICCCSSIMVACICYIGSGLAADAAAAVSSSVKTAREPLGTTCAQQAITTIKALNRSEEILLGLQRSLKARYTTFGSRSTDNELSDGALGSTVGASDMCSAGFGGIQVLPQGLTACRRCGSAWYRSHSSSSSCSACLLPY